MTVLELYDKVLNESDKQGSDIFPIPFILERFRKQTLAFIRDCVDALEQKHSLNDILVPLMVTARLTPLLDPDASAGRPTYLCSIPNNYLHKISARFIYSNGMDSVKTTFQRHSETEYDMNVLKKANADFPYIVHKANVFGIDTGGVLPEKMILSYVRMPIFGQNPADEVIDMNQQALEKIVDMTVSSLFVKTGDARAQSDYQFGRSQK